MTTFSFPHQELQEIQQEQEQEQQQEQQLATLRQQVEESTDELIRMLKHIDAIYTERNALVALIMKLCLHIGLPAGMQQDRNPVEPEWNFLAYFELPSGQCSYHIPDSELPFFDGLPMYTQRWDGHSTVEKYRRIRTPDLAQLLMQPWGYRYQDFLEMVSQAFGGLSRETFSTQVCLETVQREQEQQEATDVERMNEQLGKVYQVALRGEDLPS